MMGWIIGIALILFLLSGIVTEAGKIVDNQKGRGRCHFCGTAMKASSVRLGYAAHCPNCHREQPWAGQA